MLKTFFLLFICFTFKVQAHSEHTNKMGDLPTPKKINFSRGCFSEIEGLGCPHPRESAEIFRSCLEIKNPQLTPDCRTFFSRLYGKRQNQKTQE